MYFVDREKIGVILQYMEEQLAILEKKNNWDSPIEKLALERIAHTVVESVLDVGNAMIDGFIMRDPGSYEDIIDILSDENVITKEMHESLVNIIPFRKITVQQYTKIEHETLNEAFSKALPVLELFSEKVREYLTNELGPVSAFKN